MFISGCWCCGGSCTFFSDDFAADDISSYTQDSGSWSISGGKLVPPATGRITVNTASDQQAVKFAALVNLNSATGTVRWIVDYVDASNYHFAEVICTGSTAATLRIWKRISGSETPISPARTITSFNWANDFTVSICFTATSFTATYNATNFRMATVAGLGGLKAGLATSSVNSGTRFDDLSFTRLADGCPTCSITYPACSDFFTSGFSSSSSSDFTAESGSWTFSNGLNTCPQGSGYITSSSSGAVLLYNTEADLPSQYIDRMQLNDFHIGEFGRLIVNWSDASNYIFGEVERIADGGTFGTSARITARLYERRGGSNTLIDSSTYEYASGSASLFHNSCLDCSLCADGENLSFGVAGTTIALSGASDLLGYKWGMGTDGGIKFIRVEEVGTRTPTGDLCDCIA